MTTKETVVKCECGEDFVVRGPIFYEDGLQCVECEQAMLKRLSEKLNVPKTRLQAHIAAGVVKVEEDTYIGLACDGVWVNLGNVGKEELVEAYLTKFPTPADW